MSATYVKLNGTEGMQFGKKFYSIKLKFQELESFLAIFKEVQRSIDRDKVKSIAHYVLNGLKEDNSSFITALTTTCRGDILYNHAKEEINIDVESILSTNDGQHRYRGILLAIKMLEREIKKEEDKNKKFIISRKLEELKNMEVPVVIYAGINEDLERQMFHDINNLAKRPTKSTSLKFDQANLYTKIAKNLAQTNDYFVKFGVELDKASLSVKNPNTFLLSTVTNSVSFLLSGTDKHNHELLNEDTYAQVKVYVEDMFTKVFEMLPDDLNDASKYVFKKSVVLQGITKAIYKALAENVSEEEILLAIGEVDWTNSDAWTEYGAKIEKNNVTFIGSGTGVNIVVKAINAKIKQLS